MGWDGKEGEMTFVCESVKTPEAALAHPDFVSPNIAITHLPSSQLCDGCICVRIMRCREVRTDHRSF